MGIQEGNILYDSSSPLCNIKTTVSQGVVYAFITCIDIDSEEQCKRWGAYTHSDEQSVQEDWIREILKNGGKWSEFRD